MRFSFTEIKTPRSTTINARSSILKVYLRRSTRDLILKRILMSMIPAPRLTTRALKIRSRLIANDNHTHDTLYYLVNLLVY